MPSLAKQGEPTQRRKIVQMDFEVVTFMGLAGQMDLWNSSVRCPRRMHLTSRVVSRPHTALLTKIGM